MLKRLFVCSGYQQQKLEKLVNLKFTPTRGKSERFIE